MTNIEAMKLAEEALQTPFNDIAYILNREKAIAAIREALANHSGDGNEMVYSKPSVFDGVCCGCSKKAADGWALYCVECWEKAEPAIPEWVDVDDYEEPVQEPVAWANPHGGFLSDRYIKMHSTGLERETHTIPLYTAPPQREWVSLTDEWIRVLWQETSEPEGYRIERFARSIEAKLKEKNCETRNA